MTDDREAQHNRLTNAHRSRGAKKGWLRHRDSYMRANRKKERENTSRTFLSISRELAEALKDVNEAKLADENVFKLDFDVKFEHLAGGVSVVIDKKTGEVSFSVALNEDSKGGYKLESLPSEEGYKQLYEDLKDDLLELCDTVDKGIMQIVAQHGLRTTG